MPRPMRAATLDRLILNLSVSMISLRGAEAGLVGIGGRGRRE